MLIPLQIPPGLVISGTPYQSKGYWLSANLMRWYERSMRPVGGWEKIGEVDGTPRGLHAWRSNDGKGRLIIGTGDGVFAYADGAILDITPGAFGVIEDPVDPTYVPRPYGSGLYGSGLYGTNTPAGSIPGDATDEEIPLIADDNATWVFDNFGELPIGVMSSDKKLRSWDLDEANNFDVLDNSPDARAVVVTPERFVMALGASNRATGGLVFAGNPLDGETVTIGARVYTFLDTITTADGDVLIGADEEGSIENLAAAINQSAGAGSDYGADTVFHEDVSATATPADLLLTVTARESGVSGNDIALDTDVTGAAWTATETDGGDGSEDNVAWASRESLTDWVPTSLNTAGDQKLSTVGRVMNGKRMPRETLIWTDTDLHSAVFIGGDFVYSFEWRGDKCGALAPNAMSVIGDVAFWMSDNGFFRYDGSVSPVQCSVQDHVFSRLNKEKAQRVYAVSVSQFGEVWWFYPSIGSDDVDSYVSYNYREDHWSHGSLSRTAAIDRGVFLVPVMTDTDGNIWKHETGTVREGADPVFAESGPVEIEEGNNVWMVRRIVPDERNLGDVSVQVGVSFNPTETPVLRGPFTPLAPTSLRATGRQIKFRLDETISDRDFRVGTFRIDAVFGGER